jgi:hypothetical protein
MAVDSGRRRRRCKDASAKKPGSATDRAAGKWQLTAEELPIQKGIHPSVDLGTAEAVACPLNWN